MNQVTDNKNTTETVSMIKYKIVGSSELLLCVGGSSIKTLMEVLVQLRRELTCPSS